jgi:hypothetical protein
VGLLSHSVGVYCPESMSFRAIHFYTTLLNGMSMVLDRSEVKRSAA